MLIWSRWGILVLPFVGAGVLIGFVLDLLTFGASSGPSVPMCIGVGLAASAVGLFFFVRHVMDAHLDKARPAYFLQRLPAPMVNANGVRQTHQQVPVLHPQTGQQVWTQPRSTLFFVPMRYWPYVLGALGAVLFVGGLVGVLVGS